MRIVYLNKVMADSTLPAVNFTLFNAYGLAQAGADCELIVQSKSAQFSVEMLLENFGLSPQSNLTIHILPQKRYFGIKTNQWFYLAAMRFIKRQHKATPIDAVISRDPGALPYLASLKKRHRIATFYQPHNFYVDLSKRPDVDPKNVRKYHFLEKKYIPKLNGVLCLQESQAKLFREAFPNFPVFASEPGFISTRFSSPIARFKQKTIGYVGSLQLKKGVDILLEAFEKIEDAEAKLVLIGGRHARELEEVREKLNDLKCADRVELAGWMPFREVEKKLDQISIGVLPLRDTFYNRYLTAPNKLFDYLSRGIPVVAADLPAIRDFVSEKDGVQFFPAESADALKVELEKLLAEASFYCKSAEAIVKSAPRHGWKIRGEKMIGIMKMLLA